MTMSRSSGCCSSISNGRIAARLASHVKTTCLDENLFTSHRNTTRPYIAMASTRSITALARTSGPLFRTLPTSRTAPLVATFSTSAPRAALPSGPPPAGYRIANPTRYDSPGAENALDKASKYFLMTEMARGMWVLMEQFFRPPYASPTCPSLIMQSNKEHIY